MAAVRNAARVCSSALGLDPRPGVASGALLLADGPRFECRIGAADPWVGAEREARGRRGSSLPSEIDQAHPAGAAG